MKKTCAKYVPLVYTCFHPLCKNIWNIAGYKNVQAVRKKSIFYNTNVTSNPSHMKKNAKEKNEEPQHTVFVYFDIKAQQDTGDYVANLVCAETDQNNARFTFKGIHCIYEFLQWVHNVANQPNVEKVIVVAHNFKGYDGYFILKELYKQHVTNLANCEWSKNFEPRDSQCQIHWLYELFSNGIIELSKNIWNPWIEERIFFPISSTFKKIISM